MSSTTDDTQLELSDQSVAAYLRDHPDFFVRHPELVGELELPHEAGSAVSLVERQVAILRERNTEGRTRLRTLVDAASDNDRLFEQTRTLTLALLDATSLAAMDGVLADQLVQGFQADHAHCFVVHATDLSSTAHLSAVDATEDLPLYHLTRKTGVSCGVLRADELALLFPEAALTDGSAVLIALTDIAGNTGISGLLAIASHDPQRFSPEMGTLFVRFIGDVLSRVLSRLLG
jgi:uncharacterized protein YigA (DUF484 family)